MSEYTVRITAKVADDNTVMLAITCTGITSDLGVYGPYDTKEKAETAAREAVAHAARQVQAQKDRLLVQMIEMSDAELGEWVYCSQHLRPHTTGWCTVSNEDKVPLAAKTRGEAYAECRAKGLRLLET